MGHENKEGGTVVDRAAQAALIRLQRAKKACKEVDGHKDGASQLMLDLAKVEGYLKKMAYDSTAEEVADRNGDKTAQLMKTQDVMSTHTDHINELIIKGYGPNEIRKSLFELADHMVHGNTVRNHMRKFKATDEYFELHREYVKTLDTTRLFTKVGRLEEYSNLYMDASEKYKRSKSKDNMTTLMKILEQCRRESDAPSNFNFQMVQNQMNVNGTVNFNMLDREKELDIFKGMPLQEFILGRIARKTKVNPIIMMRRLHNSYYAAQAGMKGLDKMEGKISYPSEIHYNIEDMISKQQAIQVEEAQIIEEVDNPKETMSPIKAKILANIEARKKKAQEDEANFTKNGEK